MYTYILVNLIYQVLLHFFLLFVHLSLLSHIRVNRFPHTDTNTHRHTYFSLPFDSFLYIFNSPKPDITYVNMQDEIERKKCISWSRELFFTYLVFLRYKIINISSCQITQYLNQVCQHTRLYTLYRRSYDSQKIYIYIYCIIKRQHAPGKFFSSNLTSYYYSCYVSYMEGRYKELNFFTGN